MDTVDRIFSLLDESGMEQKDFARKIKQTPQVVSTWRTRRAMSYTKYISLIADVLNTTTEYLLTGEGSKTKASLPATEKISKAATPESSGLADEFARIFVQLTPENQNMIIAEMLKRQREQ
ncbi:helix-turn-helix transcriptional regulator [Oscillibacter sp.]|uniref:helix-turn-helix domain-containing protein n=1 Tax=Oscillibacter sp. TaxID=1945593 RepID=UPI0028AF28A9|nr:helix-turn-helix transcriptional regulator [Oscillibacter sp.]